MIHKKLLAEVFGTFTLTFVIILSQGAPVMAGLTLMLFVYTIGSVSGAHINPAVTVGIWSLRKIRLREGLLYIVSQFVGAGLAMMAAKYFGIVAPIAKEVTANKVGIAEGAGAIFFTFVIAAVMYQKVPEAAGGLVIGISLLLSVTVASFMGSPGILNPAVAFGVQAFSVMTTAGPVVGSLVGMQLYRYLGGKEKKRT